MVERKYADSSNPAIGGITVTTSDTVDLSVVTRGLYVGVAGDVKVTMADDTVITFVGLAAGIEHAIAAKRVWATGTTATSILGLY